MDINKLATASELELREIKVDCRNSREELHAVIDALVDREHDYGTAVYAMSIAATAAFEYVASKLGVTGFQASCADMDILRRIRHWDGPFMLVNGSDALYPQYDLTGKTTKFLEDIKPWLRDKARERLHDAAPAAPAVLDHWKKLAE